jgi:hypothetical protein
VSAVSGTANAVRHHVPSDMGELGFHTLSMWWSRAGSPRSSTRHTRSPIRKRSAIGYAAAASVLKLAGATSSAVAATRNRPALRLLNRRSNATSPCQFGALVTGRPA